MMVKNNNPSICFSESNISWTEVVFHSIVDSITYGPRFSARDLSIDGNVKTIRGTDVSLNGELLYHNAPKANIDKKTVETHKIIPGDLIMITTADCGLTGVFREQSFDYIASAYAVRIRLNKNGFPDYFKYYFQTNYAKRQIKKIIRKGTVANLPASSLLKINVFVPGFTEQQKVASFLTSVDDKINLLTKKKELLEEYKKGIMQKIFSQEIRFKDDNGNDFPDWKEKKLNEVLFEHKLKSTGKEEVYSVSVHKGLINQIEHLGRSFAAKNTNNYNLVQTNDIVYTKSPTGDFPYGIIKQSKVNKEVIVSPLYAVLRPQTSHLGYILDSYFESKINVSNYLHSIIQKGAKNTINITNSTFLSKSLKFPVDFSEQEKIANFLSSLDKKIELVNSQIDKTKEFKKGLLQQMFL